MQIIFDSEKQKESFFKSMLEHGLCPSLYGCKNSRLCPEISCKSCWEMAVQTKVKGD